MNKPVLFLLFFSLLLTSCMTERKQQRIAHTYMNTHPSEKAQICEEFIDLGDKIEGKPIVVKIEDTTDSSRKSLSDYIDSLKYLQLTGNLINIDSIKEEILKKCKSETKIIVRVDTVPKTNTAVLKVKDDRILELERELGAKNNEISGLEKDVSRIKKLNRNYLITLIAIGLIISAGVYLKIRGIGISSVTKLISRK